VFLVVERLTRKNTILIFNVCLIMCVVTLGVQKKPAFFKNKYCIVCFPGFLIAVLMKTPSPLVARNLLEVRKHLWRKRTVVPQVPLPLIKKRRRKESVFSFKGVHHIRFSLFCSVI
jgi:hypothetical protein